MRGRLRLAASDALYAALLARARLAFTRLPLRFVAGLIGHQVWMPVAYAESSYTIRLTGFWVLVIWRHWRRVFDDAPYNLSIGVTHGENFR